jgi:hypothetical protein
MHISVSRCFRRKFRRNFMRCALLRLVYRWRPGLSQNDVAGIAVSAMIILSVELSGAGTSLGGDSKSPLGVPRVLAFLAVPPYCATNTCKPPMTTLLTIRKTCDPLDAGADPKNMSVSPVA